MARSEEMFRAVCEQRDQMMKVVYDLVDAFWSAHHNQAFKAEDEEHGQKRVCSAGKNINSVFGGCELINTDKCKGYDCPMGFHHRRMYERVIVAEKFIQENLAERIPLDFSRIPTYDPNKKYEVSSRWYARMLLLLFVEYSFTQEMTKEKARQFSYAIMSLICIGLNSYKGIVSPFATLIECLGKSCEEQKAIIEDHPEIKPYIESFAGVRESIVEKAAKLVEGGLEPFCDLISGGKLDNQSIFEYLLGVAMTIHMDFEFDHDYPGADKAVYNDVFSALKAVCIAVLGFKSEERFDIIQNLNNNTIDDVGYSERLA